MGRKKIFLLAAISDSRLKALFVRPWLVIGPEAPSILHCIYSEPFRTLPPPHGLPLGSARQTGLRLTSAAVPPSGPRL